MSNKIKQEMNTIEIPSTLNERSKQGILEAKKEIHHEKNRFNIKRMGIAIALIICIGVYIILANYLPSNNVMTGQNQPIVKANGDIIIPPIQLELDENTDSNMIGMIVYNGRIYIQTDSEISGQHAQAILGEKLGTTLGTIHEWSQQKEYDNELASTTGGSDVYTVKGYDQDFRIMTYDKLDGEDYVQFYENLNGITIHNGADVFGKLNMVGNVVSGQWQKHSDWFHSRDNYQPIDNMEVFNSFIKALNETKPLLRQEESDPIRESRNNEAYKKVIVRLKDGSEVRMTLLSDGFIYYGFMDVYFEMTDDIFAEMWSQLN